MNEIGCDANDDEAYGGGQPDRQPRAFPERHCQREVDNKSHDRHDHIATGRGRFGLGLRRNLTRHMSTRFLANAQLQVRRVIRGIFHYRTSAGVARSLQER